MSYYNKTVCVIIPCKNRDRNLSKNLSYWLEQSYKNAQIVIVDYDSARSLYSLVNKVCQQRNKTLAYNEPFSDADCLILRIEDKPFFNMSHAINYAIQKTKSDLISIAGAESLAVPYYLDIAVSALDDKHITRCIRGRLTFLRSAIEAINGYPELMEYWGGEDDVVVYQLEKLGYDCIDLDYALLDNIQSAGFSNPILGYADKLNKFKRTDESIELRKRNVHSKLEGSITNMKRMAYYMRNHGDINNFGKKFGQEEPIMLDKPDDEIIDNFSFILPSPDDHFVNKRIAIVVQDLDRISNWLDQYYQNKQIIVMSKDSDCVKNICEEYKMKFCDIKEYDYDADVVFADCPDMSKSYDYIFDIVKTDMILFAGSRCVLVDHFVDVVINVLDDKSIVRLKEYYAFIYVSWANRRKLDIRMLTDNFIEKI